MCVCLSACDNMNKSMCVYACVRAYFNVYDSMIGVLINVYACVCVYVWQYEYECVRVCACARVCVW